MLILHKLDRSSLEITWLLDVGLVQQLKRVVWSDLKGTHVKQVVVDGECVYRDGRIMPKKSPDNAFWHCHDFFLEYMTFRP